MEQQEVKYGYSILHTSTKGLSTVCGLSRANNGQTGKYLERKGLLKVGTMVKVKDPHSSKQLWAVSNQQELIGKTELIRLHYLELGVDELTIRNRLYNLEASAVLYKYYVAPDLCSHPDVAGILANCHNSRVLRDMARKNILSVPTTNLLPSTI